MHILPYQPAAHFSESAPSHLRDGQGVPRCKPKQEFVFFKIDFKNIIFSQNQYHHLYGSSCKKPNPVFPGYHVGSCINIIKDQFLLFWSYEVALGKTGSLSLFYPFFQPELEQKKYLLPQWVISSLSFFYP